MAQILINHHNALLCPSQCQCAFAQGILAGSTFCIFKDLLQSTLTHIQTRGCVSDDERSRAEAYQWHTSTGSLLVAEELRELVQVAPT